MKRAGAAESARRPAPGPQPSPAPRAPPSKERRERMTDVLWPWVLTAMVTWAPPRTDADLARYKSIASDIETVAYDPARSRSSQAPTGGRAQRSSSRHRLRRELLPRRRGRRERARRRRPERLHHAGLVNEDTPAKGGRPGADRGPREVHPSRAPHRARLDGLVPMEPRSLRRRSLGGYTHGKCVTPTRSAGRAGRGPSPGDSRFREGGGQW